MLIYSYANDLAAFFRDLCGEHTQTGAMGCLPHRKLFLHADAVEEVSGTDGVRVRESDRARLPNDMVDVRGKNDGKRLRPAGR